MLIFRRISTSGLTAPKPSYNSKKFVSPRALQQCDLWRGFSAGLLRLKGPSAAWGDRGQWEASLRSWLPLRIEGLDTNTRDGGQLQSKLYPRKFGTSIVDYDGLVMSTRCWCQVSLTLCLCTGQLLFLGGWYKGSRQRTAPRQVWSCTQELGYVTAS